MICFEATIIMFQRKSSLNINSTTCNLSGKGNLTVKIKGLIEVYISADPLKGTNVGVAYAEFYL